METKDQLVKAIRDWVRLDNEIRLLQKEESKRKNAKKSLSNTLMEVMKLNEIDCFDINDGQILYNKKNVKKPITKKVLLKIDTEFDKIQKEVSASVYAAGGILEQSAGRQIRQVERLSKQLNAML